MVPHYTHGLTEAQIGHVDMTYLAHCTLTQACLSVWKMGGGQAHLGE